MRDTSAILEQLNEDNEYRNREIKERDKQISQHLQNEWRRVCGETYEKFIKNKNDDEYFKSLNCEGQADFFNIYTELYDIGMIQDNQDRNNPMLQEVENNLLQQIKNNAIDLEDKELVMASDIESVFPCYFRLFEAETGWLDKNNVDTLVANMCRDENKDLKAYQAVLKKIRDPKEKLCNYTHDEIMIMCNIANEITTKINAVITEKDKNTLPKVLLNGDLLSARPLVDGENVYIPLNKNSDGISYEKKHINAKDGNRSLTMFDGKKDFNKTIDKIKDTEAITKACADFLIAMNDALNKDALKYGREILKDNKTTLLEACDKIFNNNSVDYKQKKEFLKKMNFYNIAGNHDVSLSDHAGLATNTDIIGFFPANRNATEIEKDDVNNLIKELTNKGYNVDHDDKKDIYIITLKQIDEELKKGLDENLLEQKVQEGLKLNFIDIQKLRLLNNIPFLRSLPVLSNGKLNVFKHTESFVHTKQFIDCLTTTVIDNYYFMNVLTGAEKAYNDIIGFYVNKEGVGDDHRAKHFNVRLKHMMHIKHLPYDFKKKLDDLYLVYGHNASFFKKIREDIIYKLFDKELPDEKWFEDFLKEYEEFISKKYEYNKEHKHDERLKEYIKKQKNIKNFEDLIQQLKKAEERISIDTEFETPDYELVGQEIDKFVDEKMYKKFKTIVDDKSYDEYKNLEDGLTEKYKGQICIDCDITESYHDLNPVFRFKKGVITNKDIPFHLNKGKEKEEEKRLIKNIIDCINGKDHRDINYFYYHFGSNIFKNALKKALCQYIIEVDFDKTNKYNRGNAFTRLFDGQKSKNNKIYEMIEEFINDPDIVNDAWFTDNKLIYGNKKPLASNFISRNYAPYNELHTGIFDNRYNVRNEWNGYNKFYGNKKPLASNFISRKYDQSNELHTGIFDNRYSVRNEWNGYNKFYDNKKPLEFHFRRSKDDICNGLQTAEVYNNIFHKIYNVNEEELLNLFNKIQSFHSK